MTKSIRIETIERRERVKKLSIAYMQENENFPTARAIHTKFFENKYPGNLNAIASY